MSDAPAAIKGTFSDFKLIRTRKLCQIVIEVPIEQADAALVALGGLPRSDAERWVAIARLDLSSKPESAPAVNGKQKMAEAFAGSWAQRERRAFCDLPYPQQAALKTNDEAFARFMGALPSPSHCAQAIKDYCGVDSRSKIQPNTPAGEKWIELLREFEGRR